MYVRHSLMTGAGTGAGAGARVRAGGASGCKLVTRECDHRCPANQAKREGQPYAVRYLPADQSQLLPFLPLNHTITSRNHGLGPQQRLKTSLKTLK